MTWLGLTNGDRTAHAGVHLIRPGGPMEGNHMHYRILAVLVAAIAFATPGVLDETAHAAEIVIPIPDPPDLAALLPALPALVLPAPVLPAPVLPAPPPAPMPPPRIYSDDLEGWILESLDVMAANFIPGSFGGIYRNVMRESGGNPRAINLSDSNAAAGHPSKGLLQVIDSTFHAHHVEGTSWDIYDPVANITAACNYAARRYGSIDNVHGAY